MTTTDSKASFVLEHYLKIFRMKGKFRRLGTIHQASASEALRRRRFMETI
jgi:hypothetical protein